jgi:benzoylformate decarboxylase
MPFISGRQAFLEVLKQEGVRYIFGNPGSTELPLMDALAGQKEIRYFLALHEGVAISMADGYARASGKLGVVNVHISPGIGNSMGMLYNAYKAGSPLLVTAGQQDQRFALTEPILWSDLPDVARPYVKWSYEIRRLEDLTRAVHRAAKVATSPPTGPVFISLPMDVLSAEGEVDLASPTVVDPRIRPSHAAIEAAAEMLSKAKHPIIIAGDAVASGDAHSELARVAELIGAPVYQETFPGACNFPSSHPLSLGPLLRDQKATRAALQGADILFSVGADLLTMSLPSDVDPMPPGLKIIHLDPNPWEIGKNYPAQIAMFGDPKETLPEMERALDERLNPDHRKEAQLRQAGIREAREKTILQLRQKAREERDRVPMTPLVLTEVISDNLPRNAVLVDESITSGRALKDLLKSEDPKSYYGIRGGGIGWGLPAALGVKLALADRPVVALIGDGSAMYSFQGLWTAAHYGLGVVFVICNNSGYRILKERTYALRGFSAKTDSYVAMDLEQPSIDFVGLAQSLGVPGKHVEKAEEVKQALTRALAQEGPILIDVALDRSFKS